MSNDFEWSDEYDVGNDELNAQHQFMLEKGRQLDTLTPENAKKLILELYNYAMKHFDAEEAHMREIGFPEFDAHQKMHILMVDKLNDTAENFIMNMEETKAVKDFFISWLITHILEEDKRYFEFANSRT